MSHYILCIETLRIIVLNKQGGIVGKRHTALRWNPDFTTCQLCDLGQTEFPYLWNINNNSSSTGLLLRWNEQMHLTQKSLKRYLLSLWITCTTCNILLFVKSRWNKWPLTPSLPLNLVILPSHILFGQRASLSGFCEGSTLAGSILLASRWPMDMTISHTELGALHTEKWQLSRIVTQLFLGPNTITFYQTLAWWKCFPYRRFYMVSGFRKWTLGNPVVFPFGLSARNPSAKFIA